jgi:hypothetical protein
MEEPTLGGITPPSRYCPDHQPAGFNGKCWGCGNARVYRNETWPHTNDGFEYATHQATSKEMARREGKNAAPAAAMARHQGITLDEREARTIRLLTEMDDRQRQVTSQRTAAFIDVETHRTQRPPRGRRPGEEQAAALSGAGVLTARTQACNATKWRPNR